MEQCPNGDNYGDEIDRISVDSRVFENYRELLREEGIIPEKMVDLSEMMVLTEESQKTKPRLFSWLKGLFN